MKRRGKRMVLGVVICCLVLITTPAEPSGPDEVLGLIPKPVKLERGAGCFELKRGTPMVLPDDPSWQASAGVFAEKLEKNFDVSVNLFTFKEKDVICPPGKVGIDAGWGLGCQSCEGAILAGEVIKACEMESELPEGIVPAEEGYKIMAGKSVLISAATVHGFHNGLMTLLQLVDARNPLRALPAVAVVDYPRFRWRGMLLDPARHFLPADLIKRYIDLLSELKLNVLHWHLTDDQGFRVEIKSLPKLHEVGSLGEYYTQEQIREIVAYAAVRQVMIVPEIDLPGHSSAILAAYPELSCSGQKVAVRKGPGIYPTALCPGKEEVYTFLDQLFAEIAVLFPAPYVHIGSDEVIAKDWLDYPPNQKLMIEQGYKDRAGLQSYFVNRVNLILKKYQKTMIAWDEVTAYLPDGAVVQAWRSHDYARIAAENGHNAIVSPTSHCYIDYPQLWLTTLKKVYSFEPIPPGLDLKLVPRILGGEVNLWGERVTPKNIDQKTFPRLLAHAEVVWSAKEARNWDDFIKRLHLVRKDMERRGVNFGTTWRDLFLLP